MRPGVSPRDALQLNDDKGVAAGRHREYLTDVPGEFSAKAIRSIIS